MQIHFIGVLLSSLEQTNVRRPMVKKLLLIMLLIPFLGMAQVTDTTDYSLTRQIIQNLSDPSATEYAPSISADGNTIIFETNNSGSYILF